MLGKRTVLRYIPRSVRHGDFKEKVLKIFEKVGCPIEGNIIEGYHRISKKKKDNSEIFSTQGLPKST